MRAIDQAVIATNRNVIGGAAHSTSENNALLRVAAAVSGDWAADDSCFADAVFFPAVTIAATTVAARDITQGLVDVLPNVTANVGCYTDRLFFKLPNGLFRIEELFIVPSAQPLSIHAVEILENGRVTSMSEPIVLQPGTVWSIAREGTFDDSHQLITGSITSKHVNSIINWQTLVPLQR